ncbi:MAG: hypothetical protein R3F62_27030 [Planctomycetota bacterium]
MTTQALKTQTQGAKAAVADFADEALDKVAVARDAAVSGLKTARDAVGSGLETVDTTTRAFVEDHPLTALGIALGAGFLIGRWITRR